MPLCRLRSNTIGFYDRRDSSAQAKEVKQAHLDGGSARETSKGDRLGEVGWIIFTIIRRTRPQERVFRDQMALAAEAKRRLSFTAATLGRICG
jgi:hypothetical protein